MFIEPTSSQRRSTTATLACRRPERRAHVAEHVEAVRFGSGLSSDNDTPSLQHPGAVARVAAIGQRLVGRGQRVGHHRDLDAVVDGRAHQPQYPLAGHEVRRHDPSPRTAPSASATACCPSRWPTTRSGSHRTPWPVRRRTRSLARSAAPRGAGDDKLRGQTHRPARRSPQGPARRPPKRRTAARSCAGGLVSRAPGHSIENAASLFQ